MFTSRVVLIQELDSLLTEEIVLLLNLEVDCVADIYYEGECGSYKSGSLLSFDVFRRCAISSGCVGIILMLSKDNGTK